MADLWEVAGLKVARGEKARAMVRLPGVEREMPLVLVHGVDDGPQTLITGGIHGCEYTSIHAAIQLAKTIEPPGLRGRLAVIPVVNVEAYAARSIYVHPGDKRSLNRVFPGREDGSPSERLAFQLTKNFLAHCDYLIDLHGGDMNESLVPFILYHPTADRDLNGRTARFARAFGIRYLVADRTPGSAYETVATAGKTAVLAEAGQQGILDTAMARLLVDGTLNALRSVGTIPGGVVRQEESMELREMVWTRSAHFGTWYPRVGVGEQVVPGQEMGELRDLLGNHLQTVCTEIAGPVLFCVTSLAINPGDPLFAVGS